MPVSGPGLPWSRRGGLYTPPAAAGGGGGGTITNAFTRANNASSLGSTPGGQAWTADKGTWGITSNQAYNAGGGSDASASLEVGGTNMSVSATFVTRDFGTAVLARVQDANNYYVALHSGDGGNGHPTILYKKVAGSFTQIGLPVTGGLDGQVIRLDVSGSSLSVYRAGVLIISETDASLTTGTKAGVRADTSGARFDNFSAALI